MSRHRLEVADVFHAHQHEFLQRRRVQTGFGDVEIAGSGLQIAVTK
ncbi:MAG TPA: hypothetical protein VGL22_02630 [Terracidiphilus sp.]